MRFCSITQEKISPDVLKGDYEQGREIGKIRLGEKALYFRKRMTVCYIPYTSMDRAFRRVMTVPMAMCCGRGELQVEHLVIMDREKELVVILLPGTKAAKIAMGELGRLAPKVKLGSPAKEGVS